MHPRFQIVYPHAPRPDVLNDGAAVVAVTAPRPVMAQDKEDWKRAANARSGCTLFVYEIDKEECVKCAKEIGQLGIEASSYKSSMTKAEAEGRLKVATDKLDVHKYLLELHKKTYNAYVRMEGENKEYAREIMESLSGEIGKLSSKVLDYERNVDNCEEAVENAKRE